MSERFKTVVAYVVGLSILMFAWSVFKTWEPPLLVRGSAGTETAQGLRSAQSVAPSRVASE